MRRNAFGVESPNTCYFNTITSASLTTPSNEQIMSGVSGIGGIGGLGALGVNINVGAVCTGGLNGPVGDVNAAALSAMSGTRMAQLMELIDGFSSAEILIALMMAAASNRQKRHDSDDSGLGLLLGLAMASQIGQQLSAVMPANIPAPAAMTGGTINLTA